MLRGTYTVTLIVCGPSGCDTTSHDVTITWVLNYFVQQSGSGVYTVGEVVDLWVTGSNIVLTNWTFGDGNGLPGDTTQHIYGDTGTYLVTANILTSDPCFFEVYDTITILEGTTGLEDLSSDAVKVYPNPNVGDFTISMDKRMKGNWHVEISNTLGQVVYSELNIVGTSHRVTLKEDTGIYLVRVMDDNGAFIQEEIVITR